MEILKECQTLYKIPNSNVVSLRTTFQCNKFTFSSGSLAKLEGPAEYSYAMKVGHFYRAESIEWSKANFLSA
jgi:hypothetical protein